MASIIKQEKKKSRFLITNKIVCGDSRIVGEDQVYDGKLFGFLDWVPNLHCLMHPIN